MMGMIRRMGRLWLMVPMLAWAEPDQRMEPELRQSREVIPVLADGESRTLLDLELALDQPRTVVEFKIVPEMKVPVGAVVSMMLLGPDGKEIGKIDPVGETMGVKGAVALEAGVHRFKLVAVLKPGMELTGTMNPRCEAVVFGDGAVLKAKEVKLPLLRPGYSLHKRGQFSCHTFRIPGLARATDGSLLAVYDMRYLSAADLQGHMDIGLSRSTDGGRTWADPVPIMDMGEFGGKPERENGCSDPNILVDEKTGEIFVCAVWTHGKPGTHQWTGKGSEPGVDLEHSSQFMMVRSRDHGRTWSKPENLTQALKNPQWYLYAPAPGNGITMRDGTLVMPTQGRDAQGLPFSNLMWSRDRGKSWTVSNAARTNTTECAIAELSDGSLLLNMRDNRNRKDTSETNGRAMAVTRDLGEAWVVHPADHGALPEPVCMGSMISHRTKEGRDWLFFSNPRNRTARREMTLQGSGDNGKSWPVDWHLLLDQKGGSYSSLVMVDEETLGIVYESSQADLVFQKVPLKAWLAERH